jgi:hypothetical protein
MENLINGFAEGTLSPEAQVEFDKRFEADPEFSSSAVQALGKRLGSAPDAFLDRMGQTARPRVEEFFKQRIPAVPQPVSPVASWLGSQVPLAVAALGVALLASVGVYVATHRSVDTGTTPPAMEAQEGATPVEENSVEYTGLESGPKITASPIRSKGSAAIHGGVQEGTAIRIQNLPADSSVSIDILNGKGQVVRRLYQGPWSPDQKLDWDGRDAAGKAVPAGGYRARVTTSSRSFVSEFTVQ